MTNFEFLLKYTRLLEKLIFQELTDLKFATFSYSPHNLAVWWNLALADQELTLDQLNQVEQAFEDKDRTPAIYFENRDDLNKLKEFLTNQGYVKKFEDCWMFHSGKGVDQSLFNSVKKVKTEEDLKTFLETMDACYQEDDPQNPYGSLGDYLKLVERSWREYHDEGMECFTVYDGDKPVAVATLNSFEGLGYISNVGSLKEVRGKGFGKLITLFCVETSKKNGNQAHCLATEEGTYPNEFYKQIGFETKFTGICYSK